MPHFIHSTSVANLILESGEFHGTNKAMAKTGKAASTFKDAELLTLFAPLAQARESVSRIKPPSGDNIRGILVFSNERGAITVPAEGYPRVAGACVLLSAMNLRLVLLELDDCRRTTTWFCCCTSTSDTQGYRTFNRRLGARHAPVRLVEDLRNLDALGIQAQLDALPAVA